MRIALVTMTALIICLCWGYFIVSRNRQPPPQTAAFVDLHKYAGVWYEIARLPNHFERDCRCVKAEYKLQGKYISVKNTCLKGAKNKLTIAQGKAWPVKGNNSKLKVRFFWPFTGNYWIIYVDSEYKYAVVGSPSRKYLWLLARESKINIATFNRLSQIAEQQGFDLTHLIKTNQSVCD